MSHGMLHDTASDAGEPAAIAVRMEPTEDDVADARDVLAGINASHFDGYHDWVAVGFALKNSGYPCSLWDEASKRVPGKYEAGACAAKRALLKQCSAAS